MMDFPLDMLRLNSLQNYADLDDNQRQQLMLQAAVLQNQAPNNQQNAQQQFTITPPQQTQQPDVAEDYNQDDQTQLPSQSTTQQQPSGNALSNFQPSTSARQNLQQLMTQMPQYQEPGFLAKLTAGLLNVRYGPNAGEQFLMQPYNREMNEWGNQVKVAQQAAADENYSNNLNRQLAQYSQTASDREQAERDKVTMTGQLNAIRQQNADIRANIASIDAYKAQHPNDVFKVTGNQIVGINPQTGESTVVTDAQTGKPVDSGKLDETTTMMMQLHNRLAEISAQGAQSRATKETPSPTAANGQVFQQADGTFVRVNPDNTVTTIGGLKPGATKPTTAPKPVEPTVSTTETRTPNNWFMNHIMGEGPETVTKSTVTSKGPANQTPEQSGNKNVPNASDIPIASRVANKTQAMVGGQLMTWNGHGWVK